MAMIELFTLHIAHPSFKDGTGLRALIRPTKFTLRTLNKLGARIITNDNGMTLYVDANSLQLYDNEFLGFCLVDINRDIHYLSEPALLTHNKSIMLPAINGDSFFSFDHTNEFFQGTISQDDFVGYQGLPEQVKDVYSAVEFECLMNFYFELDHLKKMASDIHKGLDFSVNICANSCCWKYRVFGLKSDSQVKITDNFGEIDFELVESESSNFERVYKSKVMISRDKEADCQFSLQQQDEEGLRVLVERLPIPSPENCYRETVNGNDVLVSEIFINI